MRYEDWDILLFPRDCKVPIKEFKVACHVVHDLEFSHGHGSYGLPTVCCFVPSLPPGSPFQVSLHSWSPPNISQFTRSYSKYAEMVKFEARLFVDGRLIASTTIDRKGNWPHVVNHGFEFSKDGELQALKFPSFRQELLQQSYWSPADDLGRIKVVISEGFPRDSMSMPLERVKNVVAFSFQHAPLEILEGSSIAWPNSSMWHRQPFTTSMAVPVYPSEDADSHAHSPRRRVAPRPGGPSSSTFGLIPHAPTSSANKSSGHSAMGGSAQLEPTSADLFGTGLAPDEWQWLCNQSSFPDSSSRRLSGQMTGVRSRAARKTSTDTSMPDYAPANVDGSNSKNMVQARPSHEGNHPEEDSFMSFMKVPTNTPTTALGQREQEGVPFPLLSHTSMPPELAASLTNSLLNQPLPLQVQPQTQAPAWEVKSRKENRGSQADPSPSAISTTPMAKPSRGEVRLASQKVYVPSGGAPALDANSQIDGSPLPGGDVSPRMPSTGEFGVDITNVAGSGTLSPNIAADNRSKRLRNFTPASAKAIDEEDEPRRPSPHVRASPFGLNSQKEGDSTT